VRVWEGARLRGGEGGWGVRWVLGVGDALEGRGGGGGGGGRGRGGL